MAKAESINYTNPSGFSELLPGEKRLELYLLDTIRSVYERYGFTPIETPAIERLEVLQAKGNQGDNIIYSISPLVPAEDLNATEGTTEDRGLKFDQTVPLAAYIARHLNDLVFPFARYQMDMVFRGERAKKGRYRQFRQCDIDVVGRNELSLFYDAQMPAIINEIFSSLKVGDFLIRISNRKVLTGMFKAIGVAVTQINSCIKIVDTLEKIGASKVIKLLLAEGLKENQCEEVLKFVAIKGSPEDVITQLEDICNNSEDNELFQQGIKELTEVIGGIRLLQVPEERFCVDLAIARGLDYYSGTVYETTLLGYESLGSICSGGRYEELVGTFVGEKMPGVGLSIGLTRLMRCLLERGILKSFSFSPAQVMVLNMGNELMDVYLKVSQELRSQGINVLTNFTPKAIGKQFQQADKLGISWCVLIGSQEYTQQTCRIKNLTTGEQIDIPLNSLLTEMTKRITQGSNPPK